VKIPDTLFLFLTLSVFFLISKVDTVAAEEAAAVATAMEVEEVRVCQRTTIQHFILVFLQHHECGQIVLVGTEN
jgi:hypothetical protein